MFHSTNVCSHQRCLRSVPVPGKSEAPGENTHTHTYTHFLFPAGWRSETQFIWQETESGRTARCAWRQRQKTQKEKFIYLFISSNDFQEKSHAEAKTLNQSQLRSFDEKYFCSSGWKYRILQNIFSSAAQVLFLLLWSESITSIPLFPLCGTVCMN